MVIDAVSILSSEATHNENDALQILQNLLHVRHDLLQCLIAEQLRVKTVLGVGPRVYETLGLPEESLLRFTPDIHILVDDVHYFIDPGISSNPAAYEEAKTLKYSGFLERLKELQIKAIFLPICVKPDLSDLDSVIRHPIDWPPEEGLLIEFSDIYDLITREIDKTKLKCPRQSLDTEVAHDFYYTSHLDVKTLQGIQSSTEAGRAFLEKPDYLDFDTFQGIFAELVDDPDIQSILEDVPVDTTKFVDQFDSALKLANHDDQHFKPSFHIPYAPDINISQLHVDSDLRQDQLNSLNILKHFSLLPKTPMIELISHLYEQSVIALSYQGDKNMFNTDCYTGSFDEEFELKMKRPKNMPMRNFMQQSGIQLSPAKPRVLKGRLFNLTMPKDKDFISHSGVNYKKHHAARIYKEPRDCPTNGFEVFEKFYNLTCAPNSQPCKPDPLIVCPPGKDAESANSIKSEAISDFKNYFDLISRTHVYRMAYTSSLVARSLIHFNNMNTKENDFTYINTGSHNVCHIMQGGKKNRGNDVGNPFFTLVITDNKEWVSGVFGNYSVYSHQGLYYVVYSWRRLSSNRLSFISDAHLSCLSTGFDTFNRSEKVSKGIEDIKRIYGFRALVSMCTTQRLAEVLMDVRYLCMSFISDFSDVAGLINEKFCPRYPNCFVFWVIKTLRNKVDSLIADYNRPGNIVKHTAVYLRSHRVSDSTGGDINILSIWSNSRVRSIQDLLDELFVYVHTLKEPSSVFHEFRKCFKTIVDYQNCFDSLDSNEKYGNHSTISSVKRWLLKIVKKEIKPMGCWADACYFSAKEVGDELLHHRLKSKLIQETQMEPISALISTKACIPEYNVLETQEFLKKRKKADLEETRKLLLNQGLCPEEFNPLLKKMYDIAPGSVVMPDKRNGRMKVVDCIQDYLCRFKQAKTVLDIANWNLCFNDARSVADVCIKAQYGAKREFYVVNLGAKCMLRVVENAFKCIAAEMPEEMISCPGDTKLKFISEIAEYSTRWSPDKGMEQFFVNGDCTKWSASETMSSFINFTEGLRDVLGPETTEFSKTVFSAWSNKTIQLPLELLAGTSFITEKNLYLRSTQGIRSTQNFLQGMFNYSSSVKSIAATRLAIKLWDLHHPDKPIMVRQLGHSDDYMLVIRAPEQSTMLHFRRYHRLMQRLVGITDSSKKTNIQRHIMEFISLLSFNGQMIYPSIKKTKETGLNIGSEGYQRDVMTICSRSGESVRLGVPIKSAYIQQRLHCVSIYRAYGLAPNMRNEIAPSSDPFNWPIELFGLPDCLPVLYINSYCDINNVRLLNHKKRSERILSALTNLARDYINHDYVAAIDEPPAFVPQYIYKKTGGVIRQIREKLGLTSEDSNTFFSSCPEYKVMKPNHPIYLLPWIHFMYYNNSFSKAYAVVSRPNLLLRLSYFVTNACIAVPWLEKPLRIKDYFSEVLKKMSSYDDSFPNLKEHISCYNANPILMYEIIDGCTVHPTSFRPANAQAMHLPKPIRHARLSNNLESVLQSIISGERLALDCRKIAKPAMLTKDVKILEQVTGKISVDLGKSNLIRLYALMKSQTTQSKYGIGYSSASDKSCMIFLESWLTHGVDSRKRYTFIHKSVVKVKNPITKEFMFERSYGQHTDYANIVIENLTQLYYFLCVKEDKTTDDFKSICNTIELKEGSLFEILNNTPIDYSDSKDYLHKRMFAFFRYILTGSREDLVEMVTSTLFYRYKFQDKHNSSVVKRLRPAATDSVFIRYKDNNFLITIEDHQAVWVTSDCMQLTQLAYCLSVGKMLLRLQSYTAHALQMETGLISSIGLTTGVQGPGFVKVGRNIRFVQDTSDYTRLMIYHQHVPHIIGLEPRLGKEHQLEVDYKTASVYTHRSLIFRLSLTACGQHNVISKIGGFIRNIPLQQIIGSNLLFWYLDGHATALPQDFDVSYLNEQDVIPLGDLVKMKRKQRNLNLVKDEMGPERFTKEEGSVADVVITDSNTLVLPEIGSQFVTAPRFNFNLAELRFPDIISEDHGCTTQTSSPQIEPNPNMAPRFAFNLARLSFPEATGYLVGDVGTLLSEDSSTEMSNSDPEECHSNMPKREAQPDTESDTAENTSSYGEQQGGAPVKPATFGFHMQGLVFKPHSSILDSCQSETVPSTVIGMNLTDPDGEEALDSGNFNTVITSNQDQSAPPRFGFNFQTPHLAVASDHSQEALLEDSMDSIQSLENEGLCTTAPRFGFSFPMSRFSMGTTQGIDLIDDKDESAISPKMESHANDDIIGLFDPGEGEYENWPEFELHNDSDGQDRLTIRQDEHQEIAPGEATLASISGAGQCNQNPPTRFNFNMGSLIQFDNPLSQANADKTGSCSEKEMQDFFDPGEGELEDQFMSTQNKGSGSQAQDAGISGICYTVGAQNNHEVILKHTNSISAAQEDECRNKGWSNCQIVRDSATGELEWEWIIEQDIEDQRKSPILFEGEPLEEDFDAPSLGSEDTSTSSKSTSSDELGPFFYQLHISQPKLNTGFILQRIKELPSIEDYILTQYIGLNKYALMQSDELLMEVLKFSYCMEMLEGLNIKLTQLERLTISLVKRLLWDVASKNLLASPKLIGNLLVETTENCRIKIQQAAVYFDYERALRLSKMPGAQLIETDNGYIVTKDGLLAEQRLLAPPVRLSSKINSLSFSKQIHDLEELINEFLDTLSFVEN